MHAGSAKHRGNDDDAVLFPDAAGEDAWLHKSEGQLAVDVHETDDEVVVRSPIAGVKPEHLEVFVHDDMLTLRGTRHEDAEIGGRHLVRECHWGAFSRSIILPTEVDADRIAATLKDGVLTVRMPKMRRSKKITVREN